MSQIENIAVHFQVIAKARTLPVGSDKRIVLISRSIQGIIRAKASNYNSNHL
jgi:hypothetical protein